MAKRRYLDKAPITEAVIDFKVKLSPDFSLDNLKGLKEELAATYPVHKELLFSEFMIGFDRGQPIGRIPETGQLRGHRLETGDGKNVVQFRSDGFTFSRLKPYTNWESVFGDARGLWELYVAKAAPESVTRIAARFINHISIPLPIPDFSKYLEAPPCIPKTLPQETSRFLYRISVYDSQLDIHANVTQAFETSIEPQKGAIIVLDIDAFKMASYLVDEPKLWSAFEELHEMKNRIFFDMLTEETVGLFE